MNNYTTYFNKHLSFFSFLLCILALQYLFSHPPHLEAKEPTADTLDFSLKTIDGNIINLQDYRGKKIVHLIFWATWCPHCLMEMPKVKEAYHALDSNKYEVLAIDVGINDTLKRIRKIQQKYQIPCKILLDEKGEVTKKCRIVGVPCHIIIGKDGTIIDRFNELPKDPVKYLNKYFTQEDTL